jgi:uncharacterized membrane protein YccC
MFGSLVEHFIFNSQNGGSVMKKIMSGGAAAVAASEGSSGNGFMLFLITLCLFLIKVLLVMISYNIVVPRMLDSYSVDMKRFRTITFLESIFLVILVNNLFSRF